MADNTPMATIAPIVFWELFQSKDEYYSSYGRLANRIMRITGFLLSMFIPALYIATQRFHLDEIKKLPIGDHKAKLITEFLFTGEILNGLLEMIFILFVIRIIYDTSLHIYQSLYIMIVLLAIMIVGQYSVTTKLVSSGGLIVFAFSQLCTFLVLVKGLLPLADTMKWLLILVAWFFGYTGLAAVFVIFFICGASIRTFGIPYFTPLISFRIHEWKDTFWRGKLKKLINSEHTYPRKK
ncbi:spore germination protein [Neobacillus vireti]|uniref:spore germination protein n=1 Tax=Neobacillus vireti TaxID=220686 RepID=UPI002FFDF61D